jgi:methionyl-tRNA formyltransferase
MVDYLIENGIKISYFVSLTPEQAARYNVSGYHSYEEISKKHNIPIYYPKTYSMNTEEDYEFFHKQKFDLLFLGGWNRLIPNNIIKTLTIGGLGVHGSSDFLPKGRGRSPVNWSIMEGKKRFILQLFFLTDGVDSGDIIDYKIFDINNWDTCKTIHYNISITEKRLLKEQIPKILLNTFNRTPQRGEPTYYPKRTPDDGLIDWNKSVFEIFNFIRALTKPYPGAFSYLDKQRINIWEAQPFDTQIDYPDVQIGTIVEKFSSGDFIVKCSSGLLLITVYDGMVKSGQKFS